MKPASAQVLASLLDDCWEPDAALEVLRGLLAGDVPQPGGIRPHCLFVPDGDTARARLVADGEEFDDSRPPGRSRWLWVLAAHVPSRDELLRLYRAHLADCTGRAG